MEQNNAERRAEYLQQNKKRQRRKKIVSILACVVVFCTTYALILPAITMTKMAKVLTCPLSVHEHVDSCYNEDGDLICGQADFVVHTHGEDCFNKGGDLICELPEIKVHKHTDACYTTEQVLVCDKTEVVLHRHTEDCYDENGELICGQLEVLEHTHEDGCFTEVKKSELDAADEATPADNAAPADDADTAELNAVAELKSAVRSKPKMMAAGPMKAGAANGDANEDPNADLQDHEIDMENMLIRVTVEHREAGSELWLSLQGADVKVGDELRFTLSYEVPARKLSVEDRTLSYQVPGAITVVEASSGFVYDNNKNPVGTYEINENGHISITFNEEYARDNHDHDAVIDGYIFFSASVNDIQTGDDGKVEIQFSEKISVPIHVYDTVGDLNVTKTSKDVDFFNGTLTYEIVVSSAEGTDDVVTLEDNMYAMLLDGEITVKDGEGHTVPMTQLQSGNLGLFELPQMGPNTKYYITYNAKCSKDFTDKTIVGENTVKVTSKDSQGNTVEARDDTKDIFTKDIIHKSGTLTEDGKVKWDIVINASSPHANIAGWTLHDSMEENHGLDNVTVTISPNPETGKGSTNIALPYTFPKDVVCAEKYIVTYTADGDKDSKNVATLTRPNEGDNATTGEAGVGAGEVGLDKVGTGAYSASVDADGNRLVTCEWEITLDASTVAVECREDTTILGFTGNFWTLRDNPVLQTEKTPHYFTLEQLTQTAASMENGILASGYEGGYYIFASHGSDLSADGTVLLKRGGSADGKWDAYHKAPNTTTVYDNITIVFDTDMQESILRFTSYSTMNVGDGASSRSGRNWIILTDKTPKEEKKDESQTYNPVVAKVDHMKKDANHYWDLSGTSNHNENQLVLEGYANYRVLSWQIELSLPSEDYISDVVVTESLPEGVHLLPELVFPITNSHITPADADHSSAERIAFYIEGGNKRELNVKAQVGCNFTPNTSYSISKDEATFVSTDSVGRCTISNDKGQSAWAVKLDDRTYEIHIPMELANYIVEKNRGAEKCTPKIEVYAYIEDDFVWDGLTHDFTNNVTVAYDKHELGSASQTQHITRSVIDKGHGEYNTALNQMPYTITINPDGKDLIVGSDTLTLTDVLSYTMPTGTRVDASLVYKSIHVYRTDTNPRTDITEQCAYTAGGSQEGNTVKRTFEMTLPDNTPLEIEYVYQMSGKGEVKDLKNTAALQGNGTSSQDSTKEVEIVVQNSGAGAVEVGITVYKVDSENYGVHLNGAKFELEEWDKTTSQWVTRDEYKYETDNDGTFRTGALDYNVAYRLIETEAPAGYEMKTGTVYEFYLENDSSSAVSKPNDFSGQALNDGSTITIENDAAPYELPETGGMGTAMYYAAGGMLMLAAAGLTVFRKRRSAAR